MKGLSFNKSQRKSLSEFSNTVAAAWFSAGVVTPFFIKPKTIFEALLFPIIGIGIALTMLWLSLSLVKDL